MAKEKKADSAEDIEKAPVDGSEEVVGTAGVETKEESAAKAPSGPDMIDCPAYKGPRKAHWPKDFVPSGDALKDTEFLLTHGPQIQMNIPFNPGNDKPGDIEMVQINGYKREFPKGATVEIPKAMADVLAAKYNIDITLARMSLSHRGADVKEGIRTGSALDA